MKDEKRGRPLESRTFALERVQGLMEEVDALT